MNPKEAKLLTSDTPLVSSERNFFQQKFAQAVDHLTLWGENPSPDNFIQTRRLLENEVDDFFSPPEKDLFYNFFDLFEIKHGIGKRNQLLLELLQAPKDGKSVGALGALGVAKTTIMNAFAKNIGANLLIQEPYANSPFLGKEEKLFQSQLYFLFANIFSDMKARIRPGISASDTSTLTDFLLWAPWYHQIGRLNDAEYATYTKVVNLLRPIIPKPDLLVVLVPENIADLKEGIRRRAASEPRRESELIFATPESNDLQIQRQRTLELIDLIPKEWQVPILPITVPSLRIFEDPSLPYDYIYQIRERLGLLGELLNPQPEAVADEVVRILAESDKRQVVVIHAESMFTGKTTALWILANKLGIDKVLAFQPQAAIRYAEEHLNAMISRDGLKIKAKTIEDNSLWTLINLIKEQKIRPKETPYILIDEVMLFVAEAAAPKKAMLALETLREMGFHVIVDGIDYTFQQEPFTFMHSFLEMAKQQDSNWQQIQMTTRCRYCQETARGTRRWKVGADGTRTIADYHDTTFQAGDSEYEPVCCKNHPSCLNQPEGFQRKELLTTA